MSVQYELYLDESGCFNENSNDTFRPASLVGGLLVLSGHLTEELANNLLPNHVHCREHYDKNYINILETLINIGERFIIFENNERIHVVNEDTTYLNIISEGLIKLISDLLIENPKGISIKIIIATRKAMNKEHGIIRANEYLERLDEKIYMALGKKNFNSCEYKILFEDARYYKLLDFADIICNTRYTRNKKAKFTKEEQTRIKNIYNEKWIYPVFENAKKVYIKQLILEKHYGEAIYQFCTLNDLLGFKTLHNNLLQIFLTSDSYEQETWLSQMSLLIGQYNKMELYSDGIMLANNYIKYFLKILMEKCDLKSLHFWFFDTNFYVLTMYDHLGDLAKCEEFLKICKNNISSINKSWEHIDYYFKFCIRELNIIMGKFDFEKVIEQSNKLIKVFKEARDLFSLIKTYNNTEQVLKSELLGKAYGVRIEAIINLLHTKPELFEEAESLSQKAIQEFDDPRDISRQYQWRCLLMTEANKPDDAYASLLQAAFIANTEDELDEFLNYVFKGEKINDYLLWHYTNVMLLMKMNNDVRSDKMKKALINCLKFTNELSRNDKMGHPWNLVLWNIARYARYEGNMSEYTKRYQSALKITRGDKSNATMLTFAVSMSADKLLWYRENEIKDYLQAQNEFFQICKEINKIMMPTEMRTVFHIEEICTGKNVTCPLLKTLAKAYLK